MANKTLTFDASPQDVLVYDSDKNLSVHGGESFTVSEEVALAFLTNPNIPIKEDALQSLSREQLNEVARQAGIANPDEHKTKDDLVAAIETSTPVPPQPSLPPPTFVENAGEPMPAQSGDGK